MILQDPLKPNRVACFTVAASGLTLWPSRSGCPPAADTGPEGLGIWSETGDYYVVHVPPHLDIVRLAYAVISNAELRLVLPWFRHRGLPAAGQAVCFYGQVPVLALALGNGAIDCL